MDKAELICDDCGNEFNIAFSFISEFFDKDFKCPKCKSTNTWVKNIIEEHPNNIPIKMGVHPGCSQK